MSDNFIRLNTVFKLPDDVAREAIALSREIGGKNEAFFVLDDIQFLPHITIYSPEYPKKNLDKVLKKVGEIANNTEKVNLISKEISSGERFIIVEFDYTQAIKKIHEEVVLTINSLREGRLWEKYTSGDYKIKFNPEQQKNIEKYGYPNSMSLYLPHLTIIRLKDELSAGAISKNIKWSIPRFTVDKIAIYEMGKHGTCKSLVKEFKLK